MTPIRFARGKYDSWQLAVGRSALLLVAGCWLSGVLRLTANRRQHLSQLRSCHPEKREVDLISTSSCVAQTTQDLGDDDRSYRRRPSYSEILRFAQDDVVTQAASGRIGGCALMHER